MLAGRTVSDAIHTNTEMIGVLETPAMIRMASEQLARGFGRHNALA
jgi:hypothetical protein